MKLFFPPAESMAIAACALSGLLMLLYAGKRRAGDVYADLNAGNQTSPADRQMPQGLQILRDELGKSGLFSADSRAFHKRVLRTIPLLSLLAAVLIALLFRREFQALLPAVAIGGGLGILGMRIYARKARAAYRRKLEYSLPMAMERIVMSVEAGLDIIAAITNVCELERENENDARRIGIEYRPDPVIVLLEIVMQLSEAGLRLEQSLYEVAECVDCSALKHAFVHLALAQKDGGELIEPLRELSDATQLYYQETVEEEIAALPVKATVPLVLTFAGLIVCFLTTPLLQVVKITSKAVGG